MRSILTAVVAGLITAFASHTSLAADGDATRGERVFGACAACHSLESDRNMTGPSLAGVWNRKAGSLASFRRYSPALKSSNVVWDDKTLDAWIADPQRVVPGNTMTFPGVKDATQRADLLAFLKTAAQQGHAAPQGQRMGGMMGDRASVIFASPDEISGFITPKCSSD